ncbi:hypothetical protein V3W47_12190 [Deinococcus sp. YIM 134068]|uniref:tetratricopeptide repeat protein n=1 Tax=Deinococcus lichenicola TaxID=3118910 RepID=UPI002F94B240
MKLRTLGGLSVEGAAYRREKPLLLLAYLCLEGAQPRRRLASLFWPEAANPMNSLAQHLIRLRPLGDAVREDGGRVDGTLVCDACLLREHGRAGRHREALEGYGGAFLEGVGVDLGPDLEEWLFDTREALGREARAAALALAERRLALGDAVGAAAGAEAAYAVAGAPPPDPAELPRLYRLLVAGAHPLAVTVRREADELGVALEPPPTLAAPPLLGRGAEHAALGRLAPGEVAWVSGPPGIGKSALLAALAAGGGWRVLPGRGGLPLATLEALAPRLSGTADALAALADPRLRVAVDGWEDADDATRHVLTLAARQRPGATLLVAARDPPALPADLHLALDPLTAADLAGHPGALEVTGGHPAHVAAFLRGVPPDRTLADHLGTLPAPARELYLTLALQPVPDLAATRAALGLGAAELTRALDRLTREGLCAPTGEVRTPGPARDLLAAHPTPTALRHLHLARAHPTGTGWGHWLAARPLWEEGDHAAAAHAAHVHAGEELRRGYPAQAAATLEVSPQTGEVRLFWARIALQNGDTPRAEHLLRALPETPLVRACLALTAFKLGQFRRAMALAQDVAMDGSTAAAYATLVLGHVALRENARTEARRFYYQAAHLYRLSGEAEAALQAENLTATLAAQDGQPPDEAFGGLWEHSNSAPVQRASLLNNYADSLATYRPDDLEARRRVDAAYQEAADLYMVLGNREGQAHVLNARGVTLYERGEREQARALYLQALTLLQGSGNLRLLGLVMSNLSEVEGDLNRFEHTLDLLGRAGHTQLVQTIRLNASDFISAARKS